MLAVLWGLWAGIVSAAPAEPEPEPIDEGADIQELTDLLETPVDVAAVSLLKENLRSASIVVEIVSAPDFERWGYRTVGEALGHVVGFHLLDDHTIPNLAVRGVSGGLGAEAGIIKLLVDGHAVSFRPTSGAWLGVELMPLTAVARIEIVRGPASSLYGADAFLGVVNVVTHGLASTRLGAVRVLGGRTEGHFGGIVDASVQLRAGAWGLLAGFAGEHADRAGLRLPASSPAPEIPDYNRGATVARGLRRRSTAAFAKLGYAPAHDRGLRRLEVSAHHSGLRRGGDFSRWSHLAEGVDAFGRGSGTLVSLSQLTLTAETEWRLSESFGGVFTAGYFQGGSRDDERIEVNSDFFTMQRELSYRGLDARAELLWRADRPIGLVLGAELTYDREDVSNPVRVFKQDGARMPLPREPRHTLGNVGGYLESHVHLYEDRLRLTGGLRFDQHFVYGPQLTGRVAVVGRLGEPLVCKLLYGSAFKAPSPELLFVRPLEPGGIVGNEDLRPQHVHTLELNASYRLKRYFNLTSGVAYSVLLDKAEFVAQGTDQAANNIARVQAVSWESRLDAIVRDDLRGYLALDLARISRDLGREEEGHLAQIVGDDRNDAPRWLTRFGLSSRVRPTSGMWALQATGEGRFIGERLASDSNILERGAPYHLRTAFDLGASLSLVDLFLLRNRETTISVRGYNLLDRHTADPGHGGVDYPRVGREIFLELWQKL